MLTIAAESLGSARFRADYGIRYAYIAGAMYKGIASKEMVAALGAAGLMGYLGTGGLERSQIEQSIDYIQQRIGAGAYGVNLLCNPERPELEEDAVELFLQRRVRNVEAASFIHVSPSLVRYRLTGARCNAGGGVEVANRVLAKVSRCEVAARFLQPSPTEIVEGLVAAGRLTAEEARLSRQVPLADAICVESDSGGHTDRGVALTLLPVMLALRDQMQARFQYRDPIHVGAAGGIGTPRAAVAAFAMGADFVLTGSINQCTVEAGTSEAAKDLLQCVGVHETVHAPAGDLFELGAKVQVMKRGVLFPARANKLYELYQRHQCLEEIDAKTRALIEEKFFGRTFEEVWRETQEYWGRRDPARALQIEASPRLRMAQVFKWYFVHSTRLAMRGEPDQQVNYQIQCGPALGSFNEWVKGSSLESWRARHVAELGERIMRGAAELFGSLLQSMHDRSTTYARAAASPRVDLIHTTSGRYT